MDATEMPQTPFNMAMLYYIELHHLRDLKSRAVIQGNITGYFDCLNEIYIAISFKLTDEEKKDLAEMFSAAKVRLSVQLRGSAGRLQDSETQNAKGILSKIDMRMIELMHKYDMIFPNIKTPGLKGLERRFGIDG